MERTLQPITTGTSVLGVKFDEGVIIAADTLGSYGSLARFRQCQRLMKVNDNIILGAGGDYADYQFLTSVIERKVIDEECLGDGFNLKPKSLYSWLTRVLYNRRSRFDPLWSTYVVGGIQDDDVFLGYVDKLGTAFEAPTIATGYGAYIAQPLLRDHWEKNKGRQTVEEARNLILSCLRILFYRDARSLDKYQIAIVTKDEATIEGPMILDTNWEIADIIRGYE
ncbi:proteasome subunit beta type-4 [Tachypleus tridentatus]|uniref:proteasome subunit beta type-4 n=1 Tax=Tachypleus tridentatus TaxID=6853 RepID=UPI003FD48DCD